MTTDTRWVLDRLTVMAMQLGGRVPRFVAADLDGVNWADAPLPRRRHKCTPQTQGIGPDSMTWRCACGGIREWPRDHRWYERNSRRRGKK